MDWNERDDTQPVFTMVSRTFKAIASGQIQPRSIKSSSCSLVKFKSLVGVDCRPVCFLSREASDVKLVILAEMTPYPGHLISECSVYIFVPALRRAKEKIVHANVVCCLPCWLVVAVQAGPVFSSVFCSSFQMFLYLPEYTQKNSTAQL